MSRNGRSPGRAPGLLERNGFRPVVTTSRPAVDLAAAEQAAGLLLNALGLDLADENLAETPRRMAHALIEMTNGPNFELTTFPNDEGYDELVLVQNIAMQSVCEHHMLPFVGVAHVGYLPGSRILGLSKFARMVELHARRPQTQERLTKRIADHLQAELDRSVDAGALVWQPTGLPQSRTWRLAANGSTHRRSGCTSHHCRCWWSRCCSAGCSPRH